jgi:hypothetical protein
MKKKTLKAIKNVAEIVEDGVIPCDNPLRSCCCCNSKEDHYCNIQQEIIRNMNIKTCKYWS